MNSFTSSLIEGASKAEARTYITNADNLPSVGAM